MPRVAALLGGISIAALVMAGDVGEWIEIRFGRPALFALRDRLAPPVVPPGVLVVTPYRTRSPDDPEQLRQWDRRRHARALDDLAALGVAVVAIDLWFLEAHCRPDECDPATRCDRSGCKEDRELARSIESMPGSVLVQHVRDDVRVPVEPPPGDVPARHVDDDASPPKVSIRERLVNPTVTIARAARSLAPSIAAGDAVRVHSVPLFAAFDHDPASHRCFGDPPTTKGGGASVPLDGRTLVNAPTLPLAVLEQRLLVGGEIAAALARLPTRSGETAVSLPTDDCEGLQALRERFAALEPARPDTGDTPPIDGALLRWWQRLPDLFDDDAAALADSRLSLNLYGPPGTLPTHDYDDVASRRRDVEAGLFEENPFHDAVVFLGGAYESATEQQDDAFRTFLSTTERPMSGVELMATAYANLAHGTAIESHEGAHTVIAVAATASLVLLLAATLRTRRFLLALGGVLVIGPLAATLGFAMTLRSIPLALPTATVVLLGAGVVTRRLQSSDRARERIARDLEAFLSPIVARQLDLGHGRASYEAVCMVTDVRDFTAVGTRLPPESLHTLVDRYFSLLFDGVSAHGADIVKTYGDSMTAVWIAPSATERRAAIAAGLDLLERVDAFGERHPDTPFETRAGMARGTVSIGPVGGQTRRTIELEGDAVWLAARLEKLNKRFGTRLLVDGSLAEDAARTAVARVRPLGTARLKGFDAPVEVAELLAPRREARPATVS